MVNVCVAVEPMEAESPPLGLVRFKTTVSSASISISSLEI